MKKKSAIPVSNSSGNVFADLGLPDAAELSLKAELTRQLYHRLKALGLNQVQSAKRLGLSQADVSRLLHGRHTGFSADRLLGLLNSLAVDVEIILRPHARPAGRQGKIRVLAAA